MAFMDKEHMKDLKERAKARLIRARMYGLGPSGISRPKRQKDHNRAKRIALCTKELAAYGGARFAEGMADAA